MKKNLLIYLSGSVKKGVSDERDVSHFWTDVDEKLLEEDIVGFNVYTLNPSKSEIKRNDYFANFGCDLHLVSISDVVLVDARTKKGIGIGAEMMFAKSKGILVISIVPRNSNYRQDLVEDVFGEDLIDWIHPFIYGMSDHIVDSLHDAVTLINKLLLVPNGLRSSPTNFDDAITYFLKARETWTD